MRVLDPESLFELAIEHQRAHRHADAAGIYRQIIGDYPAYADAWSNLGVALKMIGDLEGAIEAFSRATALSPSRGEIYAFLGHALRDAGRLDEAIASYRQGLAIRPDARTASSMLMAMHGHPRYGRAELLAEHRFWNERFAAGISRAGIEPWIGRSLSERMRVGYVAADLGNHPLGRFLLPLLEHHDGSGFEIYCYNDYSRPDEVSKRLRESVDVWRETGGFSDHDLAGLIRRDQIDILVDLTMHAPGSRLLVFAEKPAPTQVTYLAYASTTGLSTIDYRLTDPYLDPMGVDESLYSEQSVRLPHTYWCYAAPTEAPAVVLPPVVANGYLTFGSLNSFSKTNPQMMSLWAHVLAGVPDSRLILHAQNGGHRDRTRELFVQMGIEPERIEFVGFAPLAEYFGNYGRIDIALDTYPWSGGATTCDALWMGVPVVTLAGETAVSRGGLSILSNVGLREWVANQPEQYVAIATGVETQRLVELRSLMRGRMKSSRLMDGPGFAREIEGAFRTMSERFLLSKQR
jgi:predicted O-linked N-acetylglucosamine transferase (SPINDLY family)